MENNQHSDQMDVHQIYFLSKWLRSDDIMSSSSDQNTFVSVILYNNYKDYGKIIAIINKKLSIIYLNTCSYNILQHLQQTSQLISCKFLSYFSKYKN